MKAESLQQAPSQNERGPVRKAIYKVGLAAALVTGPVAGFLAWKAFVAAETVKGVVLAGSATLDGIQIWQRNWEPKKQWRINPERVGDWFLEKIKSIFVRPPKGSERLRHSSRLALAPQP